ncbi:hypothetical protein PMAYCL1PPCAC_01160, partial [Pristionchus mayeri]
TIVAQHRRQPSTSSLVPIEIVQRNEFSAAFRARNKFRLSSSGWHWFIQFFFFDCLFLDTGLTIDDILLSTESIVAYLLMRN